MYFQFICRSVDKKDSSPHSSIHILSGSYFPVHCSSLLIFLLFLSVFFSVYAFGFLNYCLCSYRSFFVFVFVCHSFTLCRIAHSLSLQLKNCCVRLYKSQRRNIHNEFVLYSMLCACKSYYWLLANILTQYIFLYVYIKNNENAFIVKWGERRKSRRKTDTPAHTNNSPE